ncbi:MAG: nicotinate phosphoribosyltransferase [Mycoplasmatales bacterium]
MKNIILMSDSYKYTHHLQYPKNTTYMHYYLESRGGSRNEHLLPLTRFFGLQYYIKEYLLEPITQDMIDEAKEVITAHGLPFNEEGWNLVLSKHNGLLPIRIKAVKEGTIVPRRNVLMTIESTDKELYWLPGFVETLLMKVWYPTTVATLSYNIHKIIEKNMLETCDTLDKLPFMLHDFGYRGASSEESAGIGGAGHLLNFMGTDTVASLTFLRKYYSADMPAFSIPASEHSTITSWGVGRDHEKEAFKNMIEQFGNSGLYACVSDSWNFNEAISTWCELKDEIVARDGILVIRPDSGDAKQNILYALKELEKVFGYKTNSKGYKELNNVALIQGDGVNQTLIYDILEMMKNNKFSANNIAFGMGGALLQGNQDSQINRDTHQFAIKCSAIEIDGELRDVYKDPVTDQGKKSKRGVLDLIKEDGEFKTVLYHKDNESELITYYENGKLLFEQTLDEIKDN